MKILKKKFKKEEILLYQSKKHKNSYMKLNTSIIAQRYTKKKNINFSLIQNKKRKKKNIMPKIKNEKAKTNEFQKFNFFKKCTSNL